MCKHSWQKVKDVLVCRQCGLTITYDGKVLFDRRLPKQKSKRKVKKK